MRIRMIYEKRGGACFVPHVALAQVFSRSASRAGLTPIMTQGFSPRAKITFGPELPAGVVALAEPVDMFFQSVPENIISLMNGALPDGFKISRVSFPSDDAPNLGKFCKHAEYFLRGINPDDVKNFYGDFLVKISPVENFTRIILKEPAQNPIGGLVKKFASWPDVNIVRISIGEYDSERDCVNLQ